MPKGNLITFVFLTKSQKKNAKRKLPKVLYIHVTLGFSKFSSTASRTMFGKLSCNLQISFVNYSHYECTLQLESLTLHVFNDSAWGLMLQPNGGFFYIQEIHVVPLTTSSVRTSSSKSLTAILKKL